MTLRRTVFSDPKKAAGHGHPTTGADRQAEAAILGDGAAVLVLSHRKAGQSRVPVSALGD